MFHILRKQKLLHIEKSKLLSLERRLTLIKPVLNAITMYWMTVFRLSNKVRKRIDQ
jgi:hypothetical protein